MSALPRWAVVAAIVAGAALVAAPAATGGSKVWGGRAGRVTSSTQLRQLIPPACAALPLTGLVAGSLLVNGTNKDDLVLGSGLGDMLYGHQSADCLVGGAGNDVLDGGQGNNDVCLGGPGLDVFIGCETAVQ